MTNATPNRVGNLRSPVTHLPAQDARTIASAKLAAQPGGNAPDARPAQIAEQAKTSSPAPPDTVAQEEPDELEEDELDEEDQPTGLTILQANALRNPLSSPSIEEAARRSECTSRSIFRWLCTDAMFRRQYLQARRTAIEKATGTIQSLAEDAAATLKRIMHCGVPHAELRAADTIMRNAYKGIDSLELEDRIAFLEENTAKRAAYKKGLPQ